MARTVLVIVICALWLMGCDELPNQPPKKVPPAAKDDAGVKKPKDGETPKPEEISGTKSDPASFASLVGTWHGTMQSPRYGRVSGDAIIEDDGRVTYTVTGEGLTRNGAFSILKWENSTLTVQVTKKGEMMVPATLKGDVLTLNLPVVGEVTLKRSVKDLKLGN
jgi:hypothetical protein